LNEDTGQQSLKLGTTFVIVTFPVSIQICIKIQGRQKLLKPLGIKFKYIQVFEEYET
jgi:hypothetical protein